MINKFKYNQNDLLECRDRIQRGSDGTGRVIFIMSWGERLLIKEIWNENLGDRLIVLTAENEELWEISPLDIRAYALWGDPVGASTSVDQAPVAIGVSSMH